MCEKGMVWVCVKGPIHSKFNCVKKKKLHEKLN